MIAKAKRHAALPLAALALAALALLLVYFYGLKDGGVIELKDLEGDRQALKDVEIVGAVRDGYHETVFRLADGALRTDTTVYDLPRFPFYGGHTFGNTVANGNRRYEIWNYEGNRSLTLLYYENPYTKKQTTGVARIETKLVHTPHEDESGTQLISYRNPIEYGLAFVGERVFMAVPTTLDYKGEGAIYEIERFQINGGLPAEESRSRVVATFDLDGNDVEEGRGFEVLGLETAGDKLALIAAVDGEATVLSYDSATGAKLGEAALGEYVPMPEAAGEPTADAVVYEGYEVYFDEDEAILNLKWLSSASTAEVTELVVASVSMRDAPKLINKQKVRYSGKMQPHRDFAVFSYRDGKLYGVMSLIRDDGDQGTPYRDLLPRTVYVTVYENGVLAYKGELATDIDEDNKEARRFASYGFQYWPPDYRAVDSVVIRPHRLDGADRAP